MPDAIEPSAAREAASALEDADIEVATTVAQERHSPVVRAAATLSEVGDQLPLFALSGVVLGCGLLVRDRRLTDAGGRMLGALFLAAVTKFAIKHTVSRTRPHVLMDTGHYEVRPFGPDVGPWHSFPSGHTAGSLAVARAIGRVYPQARWPAYGAAAFIAAVQVPRGAHYPVDVLAGAVIGLAAEATVDAFWNEPLARFTEAARPPTQSPPATCGVPHR